MNIHQQMEKECKKAEEMRLALYCQLWYMIELAEQDGCPYDSQALKEAMARLEVVVNDLDIFKDSGDCTD
jgi:hypothetical protein